MRVDWFRVLTDLQRAGYSLATLQELTGISRSTLGRYRCGAEPRHADGEQLLAFWCQVQGRERYEAPQRRSAQPFA